jgi:hypothetical protein
METQKEYTSTLDSAEAFAVWVGCLGCYNSGRLNGTWVDAIDCEDLAAINLATADGAGVYWCNTCGADEFQVFDTDTNLNGYQNQEFGLSEAAEKARDLAAALERGHDIEALSAWMDHTGGDLSDLSSFEDSYIGYFEGGLREYAEELAADLYGKELAEARWPFSCIDWDHATRELSYDYFEEGGHVFLSC